MTNNDTPTMTSNSRYRTLSHRAQWHKDCESDLARQAVRIYQRGDKLIASRLMEDAATHRHLAYEARDTEAIALRAQMEYLGVQP